LIVDGARTLSYEELDDAAWRLATALLNGAKDLEEARVAIYAAPGIEFLVALLGVWKAGGIAVPLAISYPAPELEHVLRDSGALLLVTAAGDAGVAAPLVEKLRLRHVAATATKTLAPLYESQVRSADRRALIIYTSGTSGRPKGVVMTHGNVVAQIEMLIAAWEWVPADRTVLALPLHHIHGLVNVVLCAMWARATLELRPKFDPEPVWERLASGEITVFSAVPTIYHQLIAAWEVAPEDVQRARSEGARGVRLMMSGSAALPSRTLDRWQEITGHTLLERYGMTEIGMALSNPLKGERRPGFVGGPLPTVEVRLTDDAGARVPDGMPGEVEVRGPAVFREYWRQPEATRATFRDGWFRTGDLAIRDKGAYRILGRSDIDIIKTGGYKVSALEIEDAMREHPAVADCAVVGLPDEMWGQRVGAAVELREGMSCEPAELEAWAAELLAPYKVPRVVKFLSIPRNSMGKIVKNELAAKLGP
jgi:malonyl-CoA/methylmalonyl-CoA synthetase